MYLFVGDDAFGIKPHMMKPYPLQNLPIDQRSELLVTDFQVLAK